MLSEYSMPHGSSLVPHWKKDYVYALGRHIAAVENTEPAEPAGVTSSASRPGAAPSVTLSWLPVTGQDIYGYYVYRSSSDPNGPYQLPPTVVATTTFTDTQVSSGTAYYYKLTSVDMAGNESRETATRKITPGDSTPPTTPTNLTGTSAGQPALTWQGSPDTYGDLVGYQLYRGIEETLTPLGAPLPAGSTSYTDTTADPGTTYIYELRSFDTAGNESTSNPSVRITTPTPGGGGGGGDCGDHCIPPIDGLLLPHCLPPDSIERAMGAHDSFCMPGEAMEDLADHTGVEADYRIIFYHVDHLGTPRVLTDEMGNVISKHALYPFGEEVPGPYAIVDSTNTHWFTGHERDLGFDGDYLLGRYERSAHARFLSAEPGFREASILRPSSWSAYSYVENSSVEYLDPSGLARVCSKAFLGIPFLRHYQLFRDNGRNQGYFSIHFRPIDDGTIRSDPEAPEVYDQDEFNGVYLNENVLDALLSRLDPEFEGSLYVGASSGPYLSPGTTPFATSENSCSTYISSIMGLYSAYARALRGLPNELGLKCWKTCIYFGTETKPQCSITCS